jgi:hypothetical protein
MNNVIGFKSFRKKTLDEQIALQKIDYFKWEGPNQYDDWKYVNEDLSGNQKRIKIKELQKKLSAFDYWYSKSSDSRAYRKGQEQEKDIEDLVKQLGKDGLKIYRKYIATKESMNEEDRLDINLSLSGETLHMVLNDVQDKDKRTKKEKEEDDELVNVKPKIKEAIDKRLKRIRELYDL